MPWPTRFTVKQISDELRRCSTVNEVQSWYAFLFKTNTASLNPFLTNQFITACSKHQALDSAMTAFADADNPNVFVYNAAIAAAVNCFSPLQAQRCYLLMLRNGVRATSYTFPAVIKSCKANSAARLGECIHGQIGKSDSALRVHVQTALIDFYSSLGRVFDARKVFDEMPEKDNFAWCAMILAYARAGHVTSALKVFDEMPVKNTVASNTMIRGFAAAGDIESAASLFGKMVERDVVTWTTMIDCYCKHGRYIEALELYDEMKASSARPDEVTMATAISACAHLGALELGKSMHLYVSTAGFEIDVYTGSALIDMYAKCGVLERALVVFFKLPEKNIVCWSSIIDGLAFHGRANEALVMFDKMVSSNIEPNSVVFVSVLTACTHAGMVNEGKRRFRQMTHDYSIFPDVEHYGCMVDLLCRGGLLEEALGMIQDMTPEPNSVVWGALLSGCRLYKNLEIARIAADKLTALEPENSGYYTLLINMFADANRWAEVARIRAAMRERGVEKTSPGGSWIEVNKKMHPFAACDRNHPSSENIYSVLETLDSQLKLIGRTSSPDLAV
ncbi:pentatricopeptide repeat-containing protein At1g06143 [Andrographis paniculata]|uniref:pentatricopeptide repeat-containing protein At1g06143 n=1 Tax=Andrographis paniculata TaxID=175694 RepID=UPI0021E7F1AB|nr:pentatricopeptide repeat-containing protein At1g06143 [Andrographis paniculata]